MPLTLELREVRFTRSKPGRKQQPLVIITTLGKAKGEQVASVDELGELYSFRWNAELDLRSLKTALIIGVTMALAWFIPVPQNPWLAMLERGTVITLVYGALAWKLNIVPEYHGLLTRWFGKR